MAEWQTLARPYAKAAFDYAKESGKLDLWSEALGVSAELTEQSTFESYVKQPSAEESAVIAVYKDVLGERYNDQLGNFLTQLAQHDRLELLPLIHAEFALLRSREQDSLTATVESAFAISNAELTELQTALSRKFGSDVSARVVIKPELIAGTRILIADQVIDDTVASKLNELRASLLS